MSQSWMKDPKYRDACIVRDEPDLRPRPPCWTIRTVCTPDGTLVFEQCIVATGGGRRRTLIRGGRMNGRNVEVDEINRLLAATAAARRAG